MLFVEFLVTSPDVYFQTHWRVAKEFAKNKSERKNPTPIKQTNGHLASVRSYSPSPTI
jgi:hypothetical protein